MFDPVTAVVPIHGSDVLDSAAASAGGFRYLAAWLRDAEAKWTTHCNKDAAGQPRMTLAGRIDYMHNLSCQAGQARVRVLYTASGTLLSAARVVGGDALVEHAAYWAAARSAEEAGFLIAVLNSTAVLGKVADLQPPGEAGTRRHLDNLVWTLPIPEYDDADPLHRDLAAAASHAEEVAAAVELKESQHFTAWRRAIRVALADDGVAAEIESMVDALLPP
ncbi:MAG: hypothetical protein ACREE5_07350 [Acetobacteraceae bacterium]